MAYIGRDTDKISNVEVLDNITFDGSSSYTLQKGGSNFTPSSANNILISIDGVVQANNFTCSSSTIDFGTAVAGTSTCDFILHYGVGLITTPADGTVTEAKIGTGAVTPSKLGYDYNQYRNIIINGDMNIAQRGTSVSGITSQGYYTLDRFDFSPSNTGTWTMSQDTDVPSGQGFAKSLKLDCTTADASPSASDSIGLYQKIEGQNLQYLKKGTANAESLTASFWVKSTKTGTFICELYDGDNNRSISQSYTINASDTWEKKTLTFAGDTTGAFDNDNGLSLWFILWLSAGSDLTSGTLQTTWGTPVTANRAAGQVNIADSTSNNFLITGVQLEVGSAASDFEFLPYDVNLQRCQRYYHRLTSNGTYVGGGVVDNDNLSIIILIEYPVTMRTSPSALEQSGTASEYRVRRDTNKNCTDVPVFNSATQHRTVVVFKASGHGWSTGDAAWGWLNGGYLGWSAEL